MARVKMFTIRVDEAEHALFKGAAAAVPVSISEYARDAMLARMALEQAPAVDGWKPSRVESLGRDSRAFVEAVAPVIKSPAEVPAAVEYVFKEREDVHARPEFTPYSKEQQTGKAAKKAKAEPLPVCRHGLLRCKVCGTG